MNEIQIGTQIWSSQNLKVTTFRNGEPIPFVQDNMEWYNLTSSAYSYGSDNGINGYFYNYWTIVDPRNVAPEGWRVPTQTDWSILIEYLGGRANAAHKLKSTTGWTATTQYFETGEIFQMDFNGTNEVGFNGVKVGFRNQTGEFILDHLLSAYFQPHSIDDTLASYIFLCESNEIGIGGMWKRDGFPIRLIKE